MLSGKLLEGGMGIVIDRSVMMSTSKNYAVEPLPSSTRSCRVLAILASDAIAES
jgi:hypothetical protein